MNLDIKDIVQVIIFLVMFCLLMKYQRKISLGFTRINSLIYKYLPEILYPIVLFVLYFLLKYSGLFEDIFTKVGLICFYIFIFLLMIFAVIITIFQKLEKYAENKISFPKLVGYFFLMLFSISLSFTFLYVVVYDVYPNSFSEVLCDNTLYSFFDFFCFSFGIMTTTGISEITANTILSKLLVMVESTTAFFYIILLLANYQNIVDSFKNSNVEGRERNQK